MVKALLKYISNLLFPIQMSLICPPGSHTYNRVWTWVGVALVSALVLVVMGSSLYQWRAHVLVSRLARYLTVQQSHIWHFPCLYVYNLCLP